MDSDKAVIGVLIFIALIIGANLVMYAVARSWAKVEAPAGCPPSSRA